MIENIYRSPTDKWLGGLAGGLAERFGLPALVVRLLFLVATVIILPGFHLIVPLIYLALWLVVPQAPAEETIEEEVKVVVEEAGSEAQDS